METLARTSPTLQIVPLLALSWQPIAPDKWQIKLRPGVKFHDGEPMNADAVAFSVEIFQKTVGTARGYFSFIKGTEKVDDLTINIVTNGPVSILPSSLPFLYVFPPDYYRKVGTDGFGKSPIGTGPWKFKNWTRGVEIAVEPNADYWGQQPDIGEIHFRFAPDASTRVAELLNGEAQIANDIPPAMIPRIDASDQAHIETIETTRSVYLQMNVDSGPTADVRVRKGLNEAIDVDFDHQEPVPRPRLWPRQGLRARGHGGLPGRRTQAISTTIRPTRRNCSPRPAIPTASRSICGFPSAAICSTRNPRKRSPASWRRSASR